MSVEPLYPATNSAEQSYQPGAYPHTETRRARPPQRSGVRIVTIICAILAVITLVSGAGLYYLDRSYAGKIYPNVMVHGVPVGEMTPEQAEAALRAQYGDFLSQPASISYASKTVTPSLEELGMDFNFSYAVDQAYKAGRGHTIIDNVREVATIWRNGLDLPLYISYDEQRTQAYVLGLAKQVDLAPMDAQLIMVGTQVRTIPARVGRQAMVNEAVSQLSTALQKYQQVHVDLQIRELLPRLNDIEVQRTKAKLEPMLDAPLTLTYKDEEYIWQPGMLASLISVARVAATGTQDTLKISLNEATIEREIKALADQTQKDGTLPRVAWNNGDLKITKAGKNGSRIDEAQALSGVLATIMSGGDSYELPNLILDPPVTEANLHSLGINNLVSVGKSDFSGSADYRIHNIGVGMRLLNGILIPPGAEFSFNNNIGEIDAANGFVEGAAIVQNRTQQEFGGGICQDSTTVFRAAYWAGLPITERWGHSFYINWYDKYALGPLGNGPGLDATIFTGGPDLKFVNDTGAWLLIQSWSNPNTGVAQVELYGTKLNRRVEISQRVYDRLPAPTEPVYVTDPKQPRGSMRQSDRSRGGMTIDVIRTVYVDGVARKPELFRTRFKAWPNIFVINPADMASNGKPVFLNRPAPAPVDPNNPAPPAEQPAPPAEQPVPPAEPAPTG